MVFPLFDLGVDRLCGVLEKHEEVVHWQIEAYILTESCHGGGV